jgi:hypothetical protein
MFGDGFYAVGNDIVLSPDGPKGPGSVFFERP